IFAFGSEEHRPSAGDIVNLSDGVAIVLIVLYAAYLLFTIFGTKNDELGQTVEEETPADGQRALWIAVSLLVGSTLAIVFLIESLVGALEPTAEAWGLSDLFIGVMLV